MLISRVGNLHDPALVDHIAVEADVLVVAIRASAISGTDYAKAFVDEIEQPAHRRQRFSVAY